LIVPQWFDQWRLHAGQCCGVLLDGQADAQVGVPEIPRQVQNGCTSFAMLSKFFDISCQDHDHLHFVADHSHELPCGIESW
jgi:hypothetical protein